MKEFQSIWIVPFLMSIYEVSMCAGYNGASNATRQIMTLRVHPRVILESEATRLDPAAPSLIVASIVVHHEDTPAYIRARKELDLSSIQASLASHDRGPR